MASYLYPPQVWKTLECTNIKIKSNNTYLVNHLGPFHPISCTNNKIKFVEGHLFAVCPTILHVNRKSSKSHHYSWREEGTHSPLEVSAIVALHVTVNEFRCYEVEIEEWEKAISHRQSNPGYLWLEPPVLCTFLYFCLITSKFISSVRQDALSIYSKKKTIQYGFFLDEENFPSAPNSVLTVVAGCVTEAISTICTVHIEDLWELVVVWLSWFSGRALAAQARGVLVSTPSGCQLFIFWVSFIIQSSNCYITLSSHGSIWVRVQCIFWSLDDM